MKGILVLHKKSKHEGVRYGCNQCEFKGYSQYLFIPHKEAIHKGMRYECDMCSYKGMYKVNLQIHKRTSRS